MAALRSEPGSPLPCHPVASGWYGLVYRAGESHERLVYHRGDYGKYCAHVCTALACETGSRDRYAGCAGRAAVADLPQTRRGTARRIHWRAGGATAFPHMATPGAVAVRGAAGFGRGGSVVRCALAPLTHTPLLVQPDGIETYDIIDPEVVARIVALHVVVPAVVEPLPRHR